MGHSIYGKQQQAPQLESTTVVAALLRPSGAEAGSRSSYEDNSHEKARVETAVGMVEDQCMSSGSNGDDAPSADLGGSSNYSNENFERHEQVVEPDCKRLRRQTQGEAPLSTEAAVESGAEAVVIIPCHLSPT